MAIKKDDDSQNRPFSKRKGGVKKTENEKLWEALRTLETRVGVLESDNQELKKKNQELEKKVNAVERSDSLHHAIFK